MRILVVFASDNNYANPLGVTITSLLVNAEPDTFYELYVLDGEISEENKEKLKGLKERLNKNFNIIFIDMSKNTELNNLPTIWHYSSVAYYRLIMLYLKELEKYEKVIYLDCDLIIESDLKELYSVDLENKALAALLV